ncbi:hypothetical protein HPP92_007018 [Vanilla planifolia]|uniref:Small subunit processome component 20 homolog n=1 Tax=Vanilla planifolia TaxID=51239 RepID=A0A835RL20_VANPL|nr:hypothetical protein HPP92_007257 [Vanilla planifolia]KAG0490155.1 hypothetical protein HPP92_007018 [Vanilla planifolia]
MALSSGMVNEDYVPLLLNGFIGILQNRFSLLWDHVIECLTILIKRFKKNAWDLFFEHLEFYQVKSLSLDVGASKLRSEIPEAKTLAECFNRYLAHEFDSTPCTTVLTFLLQVLEKAPNVAESYSHQLIPLFLNFLGYNGVDSVESFIQQKCKRKEWRSILKEWLNLLKLMHNCRSLYKNQVLKDVLVNRLLDDVDPDIQLKSIECLLNWKDDYLIPYYQHLRNIIVPKNVREELITWDISQNSGHVEEAHRAQLIPIVVRLLSPKVRKLKTFAPRKYAGVNNRRAILCFLSQLEVGELHLFFLLLLKSLFGRDRGTVTLEGHSDSVIVVQQQTFSLLNGSVFKAIENLTLKKKYGFLYVLEDVFKTFDAFHIRPFLSSLMKLVSLILKSCMSTKKNEDGNQNHSSGCCLSGDFGVDDAAISIQSSAVMSKPTKQVKDLRSLCLKIISLVLNKHDSLDFGDEFWDIFFESVKPLIDSFRHEGSSSEKPSSLFSCFLALSRSPALVSYLNREENLVPSIFSILTVRTASDAIISSVLNFIENLLKLDNDFVQENDFIKEVFYPHLEVLIHSFHELFQARIHAHRKFTIWPGKSELRIFKMMVKYITNPLLAVQFLDILLTFFKRKMLDLDVCLEALNILKGILQHLTSEGYKISGKILKAIHPILAFAGSDIRLCICDIINCLAGCDPSLAYLDGLLQKLNAMSSVDIGELDYDTRVIAYETISPALFSSHVADHALVILSQCIYDISSDELILRQCASKSLLAFIHFASSLLKKDTENSLADGAACKEAPTGVETGQLNWTKAGIQCVIKSIFLKNMKESMTKDISIQKEWVSLLRDMVYNLHEIPDLNSFRPLCSQDAEVDFFNNILHLQVHRKRRALLRFKNAISAGNFAENIVVSIFVPLFFNMMINGKDGKGERMRDACLDSLAFIAAQMQWKSYCSFLMRCFREITVHPDKQKILVRLVCSILDNFHFYASSSDDMEKVPQVTSGVVVQGHSVRHVPPDIEVYLQKAVLPRIQKLLIMDSEKVNVNVSLAGLKLLKLLPADTMDSQLSSIIHHICSFLKNRLESLRDEARSALAVCANELGIEYLLFIIKILRATLKRGYEMHVLGYTLNLILSKTLTRNTIGSLDYCLEELLSIVENDILGDVAEEKEVGKIASKMKETRRNKSFETLKLISQSITFKTLAIRLLSRICKHMEQHLTPKTKRKLEIMLLNIASGIECNPSVQTDELFIFVYGLIEDSIASEFSQCRGRLEALTNEKSLHDPKEKEKISCINAIGMKNSHLISVFALGVLHNRLKNMKVDKNDQQLLSMLDPFVKQLGDCLNSKYEDVLSAAFRCLASLVKLPLPSFDMYANKIKALLLCIAERSGNGNTPMVQSCLKLLMILLKCSRISISDDELHMIIQSPMFIDIQTAPSPLALSLLKSIVAQKLVVHEIYDIILRLAELMVTTLSEPIRKKCSQILLQFLLDYQLSEQRLQQHLNFLLSNLSYEHPLGREAVLEMLHAIIIKLPERVIDNNVQTFFLHLVVALTNEHNQKVRSMVSTVLKALIDKTSDHMLDPILEYSLSWYFGEKQNLWSAAAQVIGLLIEVLKGGIEKDIGAIVQTATKILKDSVDAVNDLKIGFSSELVGVPLWKEAYDSLFMLEKMLLHFPDLHFQLAFQEIWGMVCKFLLHPHVWLRNISSRLVALYFAAVSESRADSEKINQTTLYLINPSKLFSIAVSFLTQLETQEMDDSIGKIIAQNIVFSICGLHSFAKQEYYTSFRKIWSMFDVSEQNSYLEAFDLLGSRGAKRTFVLSTSVTSQFLTKEEDTSALESIDNLQSLLVVPLLRKLGKIAVERDESQMKIVFNCLRMISSQIGTQGISDYSVYILLPLYKVCEGYAGKLVSDDVKQFAEEVRNGIRICWG